MAEVSYLKIKERYKCRKANIRKVTKIENASNESNEKYRKDKQFQNLRILRESS